MSGRKGDQGAFTLDTSGRVILLRRVGLPDPGWAARVCMWSDLDAFTQGYIEALFAASMDALTCNGWITSKEPGFSDLARETLARIIADCAAIRRAGAGSGVEMNATNGRDFWALRQRGEIPGYPPLTPTLGDDGKVYLREAA